MSAPGERLQAPPPALATALRIAPIAAGTRRGALNCLPEARRAALVIAITDASTCTATGAGRAVAARGCAAATSAVISDTSS